MIPGGPSAGDFSFCKHRTAANCALDRLQIRWRIRPPVQVMERRDRLHLTQHNRDLQRSKGCQAMEQTNPMILTFRCPPGLEAVCRDRSRRSRGLPRVVQNHAAEDLQPDHGRRHSHREEMPAVHRCHDLRVPHPAGDRSRGAGRRVQLEFRRAKGFVGRILAFAHWLSPLPAKSPARHSSTRIALSSSSTISGQSRRRPVTRCYSPIRSIAPICRSRR